MKVLRHILWIALLQNIIVINLCSQKPTDIQYLHPLPGSEMLPKETVIIIRFNGVDPYQIFNLRSFIHVTGEVSGTGKGETVISTDSRTMIYKQSADYTPGETVNVQLSPVLAGYDQPFIDTSFHFAIAHKTGSRSSLKSAPEFTAQEEFYTSYYQETNDADPVILNGVSVPSDFPFVDIYINDNPDTNLIFLTANFERTYALILDNSGNPVWYWPVRNEMMDFKANPDGRLSVILWEAESGIPSPPVLDSTYTIVDFLKAPPGYVFDEHEIRLRPNGHYFIIIRDERIIDMSGKVDGGKTDAEVTGCHVAEMDADHNPVFIWRCWDHFEIDGAEHEDLDREYIDYVHMNAIEIDYDGNILTSSRHLSEITKINRQTGKIMWRLGGKYDDFTWVNDNDRISYQHAIRVTEDSTYTLFDNGNFHDPEYSRALEFVVDTNNRTVTKVWEFRDNPDKFSPLEANAQRLPNGNTLINWAISELPKLTEVRPDGTKAFELQFESGEPYNYRTFRFPWEGKARVPFLVAEAYPNRITLIFNKFGDEEVDHYNIYGGTQQEPDEMLATTTDPFIHLSDLENKTRYYFRVTATDTSGNESDYSNQVRVYTRFTEPYSNIVANPDFSDEFDYWDFNTGDTKAWWRWTDGMLQIHIYEGGEKPWQVQLLQHGIALIQGKSYKFEFDAYADEDRLLEAEIKKATEPHTNYSKIGYTWVTTKKERFSYDFTMEDPSEYDARIVFNAGGDDADVYIDNVVLRENFPVKVESALHTGSDNPVLLSPNPFTTGMTISMEQSITEPFNIGIYNLNGQLIKTLTMIPDGTGKLSTFWDGKDSSDSDVPPGIYFGTLSGKDAVENFKMIRCR